MRRSVHCWPPERLLLETDAPFCPLLASGAEIVRRPYSTPYTIDLVATGVEGILKKTRPEVLKITRQNAHRFSVRPEGTGSWTDSNSFRLSVWCLCPLDRPVWKRLVNFFFPYFKLFQICPSSTWKYSDRSRNFEAYNGRPLSFYYYFIFKTDQVALNENVQNQTGYSQ